MMSLARYRAKRSFHHTPEPQGGKKRLKGLRFVVQKHHASHLHYDFRLEMEGVLKSWAVPKGPSSDPAVKRLAVAVEDHPYDYRTFEGNIPAGNYGAGTVIVWDEGTYEPAEKDREVTATQDKELRHQLHQGKIKFILHGKKLKGAYALVKAHGRGDNEWLLMKLDDRYASAKDILLQDKSVVSGQTIDDLLEKHKLKAKSASTKKPAKKTKASHTRSKSVTRIRKDSSKHDLQSKHDKKKVNDLIHKGIVQRMPSKVNPMLATLVDKPFQEEGWAYEIKWDGYRALAFVNDGEAELKSRNDKSFNEKFYPVHEAVRLLGITAILDGEIVVVNEDGKSDFGALQNWRSEADGELYYYVFDILSLGGRNLMGLTLTERREILQSVLPTEGIVRLSELFETNGIDFYAAAKQMNLEGIIAKRIDSTYQSGVRNHDWLKIKTNKRQEVVIGGFTNNEDSSKIFSAVLVGVWEKGKLIYTGKIGTGFSDQLQKEMMARFKPLITKKNPFSLLPDINKPSRFRPHPPHAHATWLKPELVCEVSFTEMTTDGVMRHPSFEGIRTDKEAREVVLEHEERISKKTLQAKAKSKKKGSKLQPPAASGKRARNTLVNTSEETQTREMNGHTLTFNNLSKVYWPEEHITKRDLLNYYYQMAPFILPYLKDRPQSLNRYPNGIHGKSFYQKDVTGKAADWIETYGYRSGDENKDKHFMVASDEASVLYMASLGCIEMNPWSSRVGKPDYPDWCIIDLDPDTNSFEQVITAAKVTKEVLDAMKVPSYCKTSGSTGIHIYIPLGAKYSYEQSKEFARVVVTLVQRELPKFTSITRPTAERKGKIYLDFLQNRPQATLAAPYSLRPKPGATVSMPLHWDEVKKGLKMADFNIHNAYARVRETGDLFKPVLGKGVNLKKLVEDQL